MKIWLQRRLDYFERCHPQAYALAKGLRGDGLNEDGAINIKTFVMLGFGALIISAFVPMGLESLNAVDTGAWTSTEIALYSVVGVAILIAVVMALLNTVS